MTHQPDEYRATRSDNNQIQLPRDLVTELGFKLVGWIKTIWYYHSDQNKVVLGGTDAAQIESLEAVSENNIVGVDVDDFDAGLHSGGRITIPQALPDEPLKMLESSNRVVLKPIYAIDSNYDQTIVSVYPEPEYDRGYLDATSRSVIKSGNQTTVVSQHTNSV